MNAIRPVDWVPLRRGRLVPGRVRLLDQTRLPTRLVYLHTTDLETVRRAIRSLQVRGAPAIGVAAAMGLAAALQRARARNGADLVRAARRAARRLVTARPTAVNLAWAVNRMVAAAERFASLPPPALRERLAREAVAIRDEDARMCRRIGEHGFRLLRNVRAVLTHCNAGGLATAEFGTALAPLYVARRRGRRIRVYADETRPLLQGARLTVWELQRAGVDVTLICDNTAAQVMKEGRVQAVLVGADRIAANGDAANKIGTYSVAVLARAHRIPFYVLAPTSTMDPAATTGAQIPIEERSPEEVICGFGKPTAPRDTKVYSPAFDVTPARLITAIVCEHGVLRPPYGKSVAKAVRAARRRA